MAYHSFLTVLIPAIVSFIITLVATKFVMSYMYDIGVIDEDVNKEKLILLPSSGGLAVAFGVLLGILTYVFGASFVFKAQLNIENLLAVVLSILLVAMVGFLDDIHVKRTRSVTTDIKRLKKGLKQWQKPLLTVIGALPLVAVNAGISVVHVPFVGLVDIGLFYPILILPLAVIFISNAVNLLGGFDGLKPGMYLIAAFGFLLYSVLFGTYMGVLLSSVLFAALLAFLPFNTYRAKIIPGDSFDYAVGASFVAIMAMGNAEAIGVIILVPWILEFFLHLRRRFNVSDLGIRQKDGTFKAPYGKKIYSLTHVVMNMKKATEQDVALYLCLLEVGFVALALLLKIFALL